MQYMQFMSGNMSCSKKENDFEFLYLLEIMEFIVVKKINGMEIVEWSYDYIFRFCMDTGKTYKCRFQQQNKIPLMHALCLV